jgi:hypothetical protein
MTTRFVCEEHRPEIGAGGYWQCIEVTGAYRDGSSRHDRRVWVSGTLGAAPEQRAVAIMEAHDAFLEARDGGGVAGLDVDDFKARYIELGDAQTALARAAKKSVSEPEPVDETPVLDGRG